MAVLNDNPGDAIRVFVSGDRLQAASERFERTLGYARKAQEHVWVAIASYVLADSTARRIAVGDPGGAPSLDVENLAGLQVGCYICEEPLEGRRVGRRCPGEPR